MDRLVVEKEAEVKTETAKEVQQNKQEQSHKSVSQILERPKEVEKLPEIETSTQTKTQYLSSLENMTIGDFKKQEEDKRVEEFEKEKDDLIAKQYKLQEELNQSEKKQVSQNIIEKPNYDLIEENKKVIKLNRKPNSSSKKKSSKKLASIVLACALGAGAVIAVTNCVIIDNMNSSYIQIDETYKLNLAKYLKNINKIDQAQQGMEFIETYPEELLDAGDTGKKTNWFDRICNFIAGLFGG